MKHKKVFVNIDLTQNKKYKKIQAISEDELQIFEYEFNEENYEVDVQKMLSRFTVFCKEQCGFDDCVTCDVYLLKDVELCDPLLSFLASVNWATVLCVEWIYDKYILHTKPIQYYKKNGKLHKVYFKDSPIPKAQPFSDFIKQYNNFVGPYLTKNVFLALAQLVGEKVIEEE